MEFIALTDVGLIVMLRKIQRTIEDYGWRVALKKCVAGLCQPIYIQRVYRLYFICLSGVQVVSQTADEQWQFRTISSRDIREISEIEHLSEWLRGLLKCKLENGSICLIASKNERLAGFNLVSFGKVRIPLINMSHRFGPRHAWSEQLYIHKDFRRQGLAFDLRQHIFKILQSRGIQKLYGGTLVSNSGILQLARKVGFTEFVDVHYQRFLRRSTWTYVRLRRPSRTFWSADENFLPWFGDEQ